MKLLSDLCYGCGKCINVCPLHSITWNNEGEAVLVGVCNDCGKCLEVCIVDAIRR